MRIALLAMRLCPAKVMAGASHDARAQTTELRESHRVPANAARSELVITRVKRCLIDAIGLDFAPIAIPDDMALLNKGLGLDSVTILRLVAALEEEFDIEIEDSVLRPELFESVATLAGYLASRVAQ